MRDATVLAGVPRVDYRTTDLIAPALGQEVTGFRAADWQPYPKHCGRRLSAPARTGAARLGFTDVVEAEDGLHAIITDWPEDPERTEAHWVETLDQPYTYLYIALAGDGRLDVEGHGQARRAGPACFLTIAPRGSRSLWRTAPTVIRRGMCIAIQAHYLRRRCPDLLTPCDSLLGPWLANEETQLRDVEIPLLPLISTATASLLSTHLEGPSRHRLVSATAEQLVCISLGALADLYRAPRLSHRDRELIQRVRAEIDANLADPPRLEDLARRFGINRTKLRFGFKQVWGVSAARYTLEQRMRVAFGLLEQRSPVSEVAACVGYPHVSNFTTAFKRRFGRSPSSVRALKNPQLTTGTNTHRQ